MGKISICTKQFCAEEVQHAFSCEVDMPKIEWFNSRNQGHHQWQILPGPYMGADGDTSKQRVPEAYCS